MAVVFPEKLGDYEGLLYYNACISLCSGHYKHNPMALLLRWVELRSGDTRGGDRKKELLEKWVLSWEFLSLSLSHFLSSYNFYLHCSSRKFLWICAIICTMTSLHWKTFQLAAILANFHPIWVEGSLFFLTNVLWWMSEICQIRLLPWQQGNPFKHKLADSEYVSSYKCLKCKAFV